MVVVDSLNPNAHSGPPSYMNRGAEYLLVDVREPESWDRAAGMDAIIHLAGKVGLGKSFADATDYVDHNDVGMAVGLKRLYELGSEAPIILASSMVVYGEGGYTCESDGTVHPDSRNLEAMQRGEFDPVCPVCGGPLTATPVPETARLEPRNVYAATKAHQEHLLNAFADAAGVRAAALRFHNVYGSRMPANNPYSGVAAMFASEALAGRPPKVFEDGQQIRDFVHVSDVARSVVAALDNERAHGAFNIGSGNPRPIIDMAQAIVGATRSDQAPVITGGWRAGDVRHIFADSTRMRHELGVDGVPLEDGVQDLLHGDLRPSAHEEG